MNGDRPIKPFDFSETRTYSARERSGRFDTSRLARVADARKPLDQFFTALPQVGKALELRELAERVVAAAAERRTVIALVDPQVFHLGLSPLLVDLLRRKLVHHVAMDGQSAVQDFETTFFGKLPDNERQDLREGLRGMAKETGEWMNNVINEGSRRGFGVGYALGRGIQERRAAHDEFSVLANAAALRVPLTVHVGIGGDGIQQHASADGAWLGKAAYRDFQFFSNRISGLDQGGVVLDLTRSDQLSEVFLNGLNLARNQGHEVTNFATVRLSEPCSATRPDHPLRKAVWEGGRFYCFQGHLELMLPLLHSAVARLLP
jgi:hypothetical protein